MAETMSLADQAVQALAMVRAMDEGLDMEHPERHAVRNLKRLAEQTIAAAMRTAIDMAWQAKDLRDMVRAVEETAKAQTPNATSHRGAACGASGGLPGCAAKGTTEKE